MKTKNLLFKLMLLGLLLSSVTMKAQSFEVYDGDIFSVMFTVRNSVAHDVKFATRGAEKWTDFKVTDTRNWYGQSTMKDCLFTFYVKDEVDNNYQVDYYKHGYVWVFQLNDNRDQIGSGWKLYLRE